MDSNLVVVVVAIVGWLLTIFGWVAASFFANKQIEKSHENNLLEQKKLFKQEVEYKAYSKIQEALDKCSENLVDLNSNLRYLNIYLSQKKSSDKIKQRLDETRKVLYKVKQRCEQSFVKFLRVYESNEIVALEFKLIKESLVKDFNKYFRHIIVLYNLNLNISEDYIDIDENRHDIESLVVIFKCYSVVITHIESLRVEMQNKFLGEILNKKITRRESVDKTNAAYSYD